MNQVHNETNFNEKGEWKERRTEMKTNQILDLYVVHNEMSNEVEA